MLVESAKKLTQEAVAKASGPRPTLTEARQMEVAANAPSQSEVKVTQALQEDATRDPEARVYDYIRLFTTLLTCFRLY